MSTSLVRLAGTARQLARASEIGASRVLSFPAPGASNSGEHEGNGDTVRLTLTREITSVSLVITSRTGCAK